MKTIKKELKDNLKQLKTTKLFEFKDSKIVDYNYLNDNDDIHFVKDSTFKIGVLNNGYSETINGNCVFMTFKDMKSIKIVFDQKLKHNHAIFINNLTIRDDKKINISISFIELN